MVCQSRLLVLCSLNYEDVVCDGLYDLWGSFPELQAGGPGGAAPAGCFPSLGTLARIPFWHGDVREVRAVAQGASSMLKDNPLVVTKLSIRSALNRDIRQGHCPYMPFPIQINHPYTGQTCSFACCSHRRSHRLVLV